MTEEEHARSLGIDVAPLHQRRLAADLLLRRARPEEKGPEGECKRSHEADIIFRRQCSTPPRSNRDGPPLPSRGVSSYGMSGDAGSPLFPWTNAWTNRTNAPTRAWRNGRRKGLKTPYPVRDVPVRARLPVPGNCPVNGLKILRPQGRAGSTPAACPHQRKHCRAGRVSTASLVSSTGGMQTGRGFLALLAHPHGDRFVGDTIPLAQLCVITNFCESASLLSVCCRIRTVDMRAIAAIR